VDFLWREQRLVVEIDGVTFHSSRAALARDHARDAELQSAGWTVRRLLPTQILGEPEVVLVRLASALAL
jgi:very-short-patch-repair endonuclease